MSKEHNASTAQNDAYVIIAAYAYVIVAVNADVIFAALMLLLLFFIIKKYKA